MVEWKMRTRADELQEVVDEHVMQLMVDGPLLTPAGEELAAEETTLLDGNGGEMREQCSGCPRVRPIRELAIAPPNDAIPPGAYCGACREMFRLRKIFTPADWAEAAGAPPEFVAQRRAEEIPNPLEGT